LKIETRWVSLCQHSPAVNAKGLSWHKTSDDPAQPDDHSKVSEEAAPGNETSLAENMICWTDEGFGCILSLLISMDRR